MIVRPDQRLAKIFVKLALFRGGAAQAVRERHAEGTTEARPKGAIVVELGDYWRARDFHDPRTGFRFDRDVRRPPLEEGHFADYFAFGDSAHRPAVGGNHGQRSIDDEIKRVDRLAGADEYLSRRKIVKAADTRQEHEVAFPELAEDDRGFGQRRPAWLTSALFSIAERINAYRHLCVRSRVFTGRK